MDREVGEALDQEVIADLCMAARRANFIWHGWSVRACLDKAQVPDGLRDAYLAAAQQLIEGPAAAP
jgi:hypothetical protein